MGLDRASTKDLLATIASVALPAQWCQAFFLLAAAGVLAVAATPPEARSLLMDYGARNAFPQNSSHGKQHQAREQPPPTPQGQDQNQLLSLVAAGTAWTQVPHSWFMAFYVTSLACSLFWAVQYVTEGTVLQSLVARQAAASGESATLPQVAVAWAMMLLQATRRVYEHLTIIRPSSSTMWAVHWLLGLCFYLFINVAVWIEGAGTVLKTGPAVDPTADAGIEAISGSNTDQTYGILSTLKICVAIPVYLFAWFNQHSCHAHLAGLKKYSLPQAGLFRRLICPHYTCECLIYLSLAIAAAPGRELCNKTLLCALAFVVVNLGVTTVGTRKWYVDKFDENAVAGKWNMIPFIF